MLVLLIISLASSLKLPLKAVRTPIADPDSSISLSGGVHVSNYYNTQYYSVITAGTPPSQYTVKLDTGSTYLWLQSVECADCHFAANQFDSSLSSTYEENYVIKTLLYGSKNVTGYFSNETFSVDGIDGSHLEATDVVFVLTYEEFGLEALESDGILGLSFSNSNLGGYLNFVDSLKAQGQITSSMFSLYFTDNMVGAETEPESNIMIGGYDMMYSQETELRYVNVYETSGFWFADLDSLTVNGADIGVTTNYALFHSGEPMILGPTDDINLMVKLVKGTSFCYNLNSYNFCPCKDYSAYPVFALDIDGEVFELGPQEYLLKVSGWCMILMEPRDNMMAIILSIPFLRKYYSVFDLDNARVGLALAVEAVIIDATTNQELAVEAVAIDATTNQASASGYAVIIAVGVAIVVAGRKIVGRKNEYDYSLAN